MTDCGHLALVASGEGRGLCVLCQREEIERLRANADSLWQDVQSADEANKELCADNERLRTLVKELADELAAYSRGFRVAGLRHYQPDLDVVQRARALVQKP